MRAVLDTQWMFSSYGSGHGDDVGSAPPLLLLGALHSFSVYVSRAVQTSQSHPQDRISSPAVLILQALRPLGWKRKGAGGLEEGCAEDRGPRRPAKTRLL